MPHPIFEIDELLRLVIDELVEASPRTTVSFALTCRSLEEPVLSSLWKERQHSLTVLLIVLRDLTWVSNNNGLNIAVGGCSFSTDRILYRFHQTIERNPSAEAWARFRRYASWMRKLCLNSYANNTSDIFSQLSHNSPGGILCPKLDHLSWDIPGIYIVSGYLRLFFSPSLKRVDLHGDLPPCYLPLEPLVQTISFLPTSLESLSFPCDWGKEEPLRDALSSFICRCGPSLRTFHVRTQLSEAAIHHLMRLPNLRHWSIHQGPPRTVPTSIFPSLERLCIEDPAAPVWLHLLTSPKNGTAQDGFTTATSHAGITKTLKSLKCPSSTTIDSTLVSSIIKFQNLVTLEVQLNCFRAGTCIFHLTDDDMENLAIALPRLESLRLGQPCNFHTCKTTVAALMSISVHCLDLTVLEIHFSTLEIVRDLQRVLDRGAGRDDAKCRVSDLPVGGLSFEVQKNIETVVMGFRFIFPCLRRSTLHR